MRIVNGYVVFEKTKCSNCWGEGTVATPLPCPTCNGTGNGARGGKGGCKKCHGMGRAYDQDVRQTCPACKGIDPMHARDEDMCSTIADDDYRAMEFRVYRSNRPTSWNEMHLGHNCVVSVTDYGSHKRMSDDELIEDVRSNGHVQATKIADYDTRKVCDHVGIFTSDNGYSVRAVFTTAEAVANDAASELRPDEALAYGGIVYQSGGNGTMAAVNARITR